MNEDSAAIRPNSALHINVVPFRGGSLLGNVFYPFKTKQPFILAGSIKNRDHVFDETRSEDLQ